MPTQLTLDIYQSREQRDKGIEKAVSSANSASPGWGDRAFKMFKEWLAGWTPGHKFTIEQFRFSAEIQGLEKPPSSRAYGAIAVRAKKEGLVKAGDKVATESVTAHRCFATQWIKI